MDHELNARDRLMESDASKVLDKVGRAYGILQNSHMLSSGEAMNLLSLLRLGIDLGVFPDDSRCIIDRLFIEAQPGHIQSTSKQDLDSNQRDILRAEKLRMEFAAFAKPNFLMNGRN